jgi:hypothetical protein
VELRGMENRKNNRINKSKVYYLKKNNRIDKSLTRVAEKK